MEKSEINSRKAVIRQEIKDRMQRELDRRKAEIKERVKHQRIPVEEKRAKYRRKVHEEKLRLMNLAREEFVARKRMLGPEAEEEPRRELYEEPPPLPPEARFERELEADEDADFIQHEPRVRAEEAFVYEDEDESDVREFEAPIGESDAMPPVVKPAESELAEGEPPGPGKAGGKTRPGPGRMATEASGTKNLFYYIVNLISHPVVTLDEFDDYLAAPSGLFKVVLFYFVSLLPVVLFAMMAEDISEYLPGGTLGRIIGSDGAQADPLMLVGRTVFNLLIYCLSVSIVNYFITDEANFITLTLYFAFVEGVTRIVTYTIVILAVVAAVFVVASPQLMGPAVGVAIILFLTYVIWTFALNMIVLMSAYGYDFITALLLSLGAGVVRSILMAVIVHQFGSTSF